MKLLAEKRADYFYSVYTLGYPVKICTFSPITNWHLLNAPGKVLMNTQAYKQQKKMGKDWEFKTNNSVHAKIFIGPKGFYIGSWNFSNNSTQQMHEIGLIITKDEQPQIYKEVEEYFDSLWERSKF